MNDKEKDTEGKEVQQANVNSDVTPVVDAASEPVLAEKKAQADNTGTTDGEREKKAPRHKEDKKGVQSSSSVLGNKTIEDVIKNEAKEEQDTSSPFSLPRTLGGVMIARAFQKQMGLVCLVCAFFIIYINNRYVCQKRMVEIDKMERKMVDARYKATVCTSILTEKSRESNIMHLLGSYGDSTLTIPNEPPYLIRVDE